jgi:hypothetical protein
MNAYGSIAKVLNKIVEAKRPERFTQDYLETVLALPSSSLRPVIPLLKRIGFLNADGTPTELYSKFKTESGRKTAMAAGLKIGYPEIFKRNEFAYKLDKPKLTDLVVEMTGLERDNGVVRNIIGTFSSLNSFADFEQSSSESSAASSERILGWPAPGSEDTKIGVTMGPEVQYGGKATVYSGVQA